jgi:sortase (surface protein transpeptidase)
MRRPLTALVAFLLLALVGPSVWWLTRPPVAAGESVISVGASPSPSLSPSASLSVPSSSTEPTVVADAAAPSALPQSIDARPVRLRIAAIRLDAGVEPVGVQANGSMTLPPEAGVVGWYRFGPAPGSVQGAAVIAGHVDARGQGPGALFRLREVGVGDSVEVTRSDGVRVGYRVVAKETIMKQQLPTERLFARDGVPRLVLITCGGPYLPQLSSYRDNVVVVAEQVP